MKYLSEGENSLSKCDEWKGKQAQGTARTLLCTPFPDKRPLAQMRIDRQELPSQTGTPGKHQIRLKIPRRVRDSEYGWKCDNPHRSV